MTKVTAVKAVEVPVLDLVIPANQEFALPTLADPGVREAVARHLGKKADDVTETDMNTIIDQITANQYVTVVDSSANKPGKKEEAKNEKNTAPSNQ